MICSLPTPRWVNPYRTGLQSAVENLALQKTTISWAEAIATAPFVYYNLYWSEDLIGLFDQPRAFAIDRLTADIPYTIAGDGYYFGVRAARLGVAEDFSQLGNMALNVTAFSYPALLSSLNSFSTISATAALQVASTAGYPIADGYLLVSDGYTAANDQIVLYSTIGTSSGNPAFIIANWDPFECNDGYNFAIGSPVRLFRGFEEGNSVLFQRTSSCGFLEPQWADKFRPGIQLAEDLGLGSVVQISWKPATTPTGLSETYYNIYWSTELTGLFDTPRAITDALTVKVPGLHGGDGYFFGVRATYYPQNQDIAELNSPTPDYYEYPAAVTVNEVDGYYAETDLTPLVVSPNTAEFPNSGYLKIGTEALVYTSKTSNTFIISQRDAFSLGNLETHANGAAVTLLKGIEDFNLSYQFAVPTWDAGNIPPWLPPDPSDPDGYASMQGSDGYRTWIVDQIHEDHSEFESENEDFLSADEICGSYRANMTTLSNIYTGAQCGTYFGGREDGFGGGVRLTEVNLRREEMLLAQTGEPIMLLRAKVTGPQCPRYSIRGEHSTERCSLCYGTKIMGGYDRFAYSRLYRPGITNPNGMIAMRVQPYKNDIPLIQYRGVSQTDELMLWTLAIPTIKKRDVLIRYLPVDPGEIPTEEFRYEVLSVERNRLLFSDDGKQSISARKLDKTHDIYTFPVSLVSAAAVV